MNHAAMIYATLQLHDRLWKRVWKKREARQESGVPENESTMRTLLQALGDFRIMSWPVHLSIFAAYVGINVQSFDDHTHTHTHT